MCSLQGYLLLVVRGSTAYLGRNACKLTEGLLTEVQDRIQVGARLLVQPRRKSRVPPAAGLYQYQL